LFALFSKTAIEVCEGQQYDMDFETQNDVTIAQYLKMITYKTAVLIAAALQMGAIVAKASDEQQQHIYEFGLQLGIAFQLQDDYLDAFGNPENFGKQVGGDIIENKKTYLFLKALANGSENEKKDLKHLFSESFSGTDTEKIVLTKKIFESSGAAQLTQNAIKQYTQEAFSIVETLQITEENKKLLIDFGTYLMNRRV